MMSKVDMVMQDFESLQRYIGQIALTHHDRVNCEMALANLRDSLRDLGVEVPEPAE